MHHQFNYMSPLIKDYVFIVFCWINSKILKHIIITEILRETLQDYFELKLKSEVKLFR